MRNYSPPKKPRPLTLWEIKEIEDALETVCQEIELVLEARRLDSESSSKRKDTKTVQPSEGKPKVRLKGSRRPTPTAT